MAASSALEPSKLVALALPEPEAAAAALLSVAAWLSCSAIPSLRYRPSARLSVIESMVTVAPGTVFGSGAGFDGPASFCQAKNPPPASRTRTRVTSRSRRPFFFFGGSTGAAAPLAGVWVSCRAAVTATSGSWDRGERRGSRHACGDGGLGGHDHDRHAAVTGLLAG